MNTIKKTGIIVVLGILFLPLISAAQSTNTFANLKAPAGPGDREATVRVALNGAAPNTVKVFVNYSNNREQLVLATADIPNGRASCRPTSTDNLSCSFIFPHESHPTPNILSRAELESGSGPEDRATHSEYAATQVNSATRNLFRLTDRNGKVFDGGESIYYRWVRVIGQGRAERVFESEILTFDMPRVFTVANAGDSYASGEGAPNRPLLRSVETVNGVRDDGGRNEFTEVPMWDDVVCHRSSASGQMLAIKKLVRNDPTTAVKYVNVSCSGATIGEGMLAAQQYSKPLPGAFWDPAHRRQPDRAIKVAQIQAIRAWLDRNDLQRLDALVLSIGGNDIGFATIAGDCMMDFVGDCRDSNTVRDFLNAALRTLPGSYENLNAALQEQLPDARIFLIEYPDPTRDAEGLQCSPSSNGNNPIDCWGALERTIEQRDFAFIFDQMITPLNDTISRTANRFGWTFLRGTVAASRTHGLCNCAAPFFHTPGQSDDYQGDRFGSIHPNNDGHKAMYEPIVYRGLTSEITATKRKARVIQHQADLNAAKATAKAAAKAKILERNAERAAATKAKESDKATQAKKLGTSKKKKGGND